MKEQDFDSLATHVEGIHNALRSLAIHLKGDERATVIRSQLEWAVSHLFEVVHEIRGRGPTEERSEAMEVAEVPLSFGTGLMEGLRGHTQAVTIPEILGFISTLRKSGVLRVTSEDEDFLIQLEEGSVVYAQGDNPPPGQRLGEILVTQGALSQEDLDRIVERDKGVKGVLGKTLLKEGIVGKEALCIALTYQVQALFRRFFNAEGALFQFNEDVPNLPPGDIRLNVTSLLLESARSNDEEDRDASDESLRRSA